MVFSNIDYVFLLKKDIPVNNIGYTISVVISAAMCTDDSLKKLHVARQLKPYVFDCPRPGHKNGLYEKNAMYKVQIRSCSDEFASKITKLLEGFENDYVQSVMVQRSIQPSHKEVGELVAINPVIVTLPKGENNKFDVNTYGNVQDKVIKNLIKKYNHFAGENVTYEDAKGMFLVERIMGRPIPVKIKGQTYLGVRFKYTVADSPLANKLAYFAQYVGLGEKNSICGAGFCYASPRGIE